jgi:hypothetical protein
MDWTYLFSASCTSLAEQPGMHKHADEFNRVQRGHQNYFERKQCTGATAVADKKYCLVVT